MKDQAPDPRPDRESAFGKTVGVRPTVRLITDPALAGVTGRYFDRFTDTAAHEQAYDPRARARLGALTRELLA